MAETDASVEMRQRLERSIRKLRAEVGVRANLDRIGRDPAGAIRGSGT